MFFERLILFIFLFSPLLSHAKQWTSLLHEFEQYAEESRQKCQAVGMAVAIVKDGKVVYSKGFGQRSLTDPEPVTTDTLFQIGSMSKSFTTALTALAVDQEKIAWGDRVMDHLPSFVLYDPWVTRAFLVDDLFAQRSGLVPYAGDTQAILGVPIDVMIHNLRFFSPITSFRSSFAYQNVFFSVGAKLLYQATGKTWESLLKEEIFSPLQMSASSCDLNSYLKTENRAGWHIRKPDGSVALIPETFGSADWIYIYAPAGGINSTILDMSQWLMLQADSGMYHGKQLISKQNLSQTHRPHVFIGEYFGRPCYYCLGWILEEFSPYPILWHNGATSAVNNNMAIIPQERLGIVVLCNTRDTVVAEALTLKFFDLYFEKPAVDWTEKMLQKQREDQEKAKKNERESMTHPLPSLPLKDYTGIYSNPVYGKAVVSVKGDGLEIKIGPRGTQWELKPYNRDAFSLSWPWVEADSKASFYLDPNGKPQILNIGMLESENESTFKREVE